MASSCSCENQKPYLVKEFDVEGSGVLKVYTLAGNIEVQSVSESSRVRVELYIERGYALWSDSKNLDNYRINVLQRGSEVIASVERKRKSTGFFSDNMTFSYKIYVPEMISTELRTLGGNILLTGVRGEQRVKTGGGSIRLDNLTGRIQAYTAGGAIELNRNRGTIYAQTEGGRIQIEDSDGEVRLRSAGGDIISRHTSGSFVAKTDAGNIHAQFFGVGEGIHLETSAGNIYAEIPEDIGFNMLATASGFNLDELDHFYGDKTTHKIEGYINDGGVPLQLKTSSGIITVKSQ